MAWTITRLLKQWEPYAYDFGQENRNKKLAIVKQRVLFHKRNAEEVKQWYHRMLFVLAYPDDARMYRRAEFQLKHLGEDLKKGHAASCTEWVNSGLPYSVTNTRFSHQLLCWLAQQVDVEAEADVLEEDAWPLSEVLKPALPVLMKEICSTGLEGMELLDALKVKRGERLLFLLNHFSFIADSECRELLWDRIRLFVSLRSSSAEFSKAGNRLPFEHLFFSESLLKQFNTKDLLNTPLPAPESLSFLQASSIIQCVRYSLVLLNRETDPSTFMEEKSLRYYVLERGYSVALYGLTQERQLPLQVYVGYTLFRNGMPMAYGGAW
ncbi:MAG TPA: hypothetical protein PLP34_09735, partial [Chitinophagaceae bacterium]|nr:hypothetical protein [Chitinophagaceae bacterium]